MIKESRGRLLIGGHRGHLSDTRENTIANFEEVLAAQVDYIEIDVQMTKDKQAVIFHDQDLSFRTPLHGRICDYAVTELKTAFDLCTLDEAVSWCSQKGMPVLLEIKSIKYRNEEKQILASRIVDTLSKYSFFDRCIVFSIDYQILRMIKQLQPTTDIALIVPHIPEDPVQLLRDMDACIYLNFVDGISTDIVSELHNAHFLVDGSVVNTKEQLLNALELNVDMIESDHPELIRSMYYELKKAVNE